ncbi:MAG: hypothetical protein E6Q97_34675 [Desulfurellales bacterium]|nr:MAG: hypothetical protein E6Q97_34675 [Desulfurellales bacterium]
MTPEQIAAGAACYQCLNEDQKRAAVLYLLDQMASSGSGGTGLFVLKAGDTMTGQLVITAGGETISGGRFVVSTNGALSAPAVSFTGTPITGGTATTTKPMVLIETSGATSNGWNTSGTMFGVNSSGGSLLLFDFQSNGSSRLSLSTGGNLIQAAAGALQWLSRGILTSPASGTIQLGAADVAAPVAQTLSVQSVVAGTTDTAGVNWTFNGSRGTGTGAGGSVIFQTAPAGSTGSSPNALVTQLTIRTDAGFQIGSAGASQAPYIFSFSGSTPSTQSVNGRGLSLYTYGNTANDSGIALVGTPLTVTSGTGNHVWITRSFSPTSGTAVENFLTVSPTINQTGGANGITRALYINPTLTAAADFRALEITDGNVVLPKTITAGGTTGAQTINKVTGSVNFAAAATSLVVTNAYVTANSNIQCTIATNDATAANVKAVAGAGSFTIYLGTAPTAETRVNFTVTN